MKFLVMIIMILVFAAMGKGDMMDIEQWGIFEVSLKGPTDGNPFLDVEISAEFSQGSRVLDVMGFYDGAGIYRVRFMPDATGEWKYQTKSNLSELDGQTGKFICIEPSPENHGPVGVKDTYYFSYADGTPYFQIGTTCYAWVHQGDELEEQTLATLKDSPFNKIRMCVFPKSYVYNQNEPQYYPFMGKPLRDWDFTRFNPEFFRHFEKRVSDLRELGIEADIILFHPYDRWGYQSMDADTDDRYLRYMTARLSAYRNVWWSMANEYDFMKDNKESDWDRFFQIVRDNDPYNHLRGIHNGSKWYDHTKPWVTHASLQTSYFPGGLEWREKYKKPIVYDECRYEGDIPQGWGNITPQEMTRNFWWGTVTGCYVGHGETYKHPEDILWWSKGGVLHGQSPERIAFLKRIIEEGPLFEDMKPTQISQDVYALSKAGECYLIYFVSPNKVDIKLPGERSYKVDFIDTWNMDVIPIESATPGEFSFDAPDRDYLLRLMPYTPGDKMRPIVEALANPKEGIAPLEVEFSTSGDYKNSWDFGDGNKSSEANPKHVYEKPGFYRAKLMVIDEAGQSATRHFLIGVDSDPTVPIVKVGFKEGDSPQVTLHGDIIRGDDGSFDLGNGEPWKWIDVGDGPMADLEALSSFTIMGWLNPSSLEVGSGGNRIAFNLKVNSQGFDLVCLKDGRLRLSVNEWPDAVNNDSSSGMMRVGKWTFFAVTYDGSREKDNVSWYFGDMDKPAELDRIVSYPQGKTKQGSGELTIGNFNSTMQGYGLDRQFRGKVREIVIFGSRVGSNGVKSLDIIRGHQRRLNN